MSDLPSNLMGETWWEDYKNKAVMALIAPDMLDLLKDLRRGFFLRVCLSLTPRGREIARRIDEVIGKV